MAFNMGSKPIIPASAVNPLLDELSTSDAQAIVKKVGSLIRPPLSSILDHAPAPAPRYTYWADGEWRINFNGTEYSGFDWIDCLAAFEDLGLEPSKVQAAYDIYTEFLQNLDGISLSEVKNYAKAKKEGRLLILPEGVKADSFDLTKPLHSVSIPTKIAATNDESNPMKLFGDTAVNAYLSHLDLYTCPLCGKTAQNHRCMTPGTFVAECPYCDKLVSIDLNHPDKE